MSKARDKQLKDSWDAFCDELKSAGDIIFRDTTPDNDIMTSRVLKVYACSRVISRSACSLILTISTHRHLSCCIISTPSVNKAETIQMRFMLAHQLTGRTHTGFTGQPLGAAGSLAILSVNKLIRIKRGISF